MSGLLRQILLYNLLGMGLLLIGFLYFGSPREDLARAHADSLKAQTIILAAALEEACPPSELPACAAARLPRLAPPDAQARIHTAANAADTPALQRALQRALAGTATGTTTNNNAGEPIFLAAAPLRAAAAKTPAAALILTAGSEKLAALFQAERQTFAGIFLFILAVTCLLCIALAFSIARPIRLLADTADHIRAGIANRRIEVPDFSNREDEVGSLSVAMREMTRALYDQIDAVAGFGADVAHELKNPLTSLRSALETFMSTDDPESRAQLKPIIFDDIERINRLITDISSASRLDSDMAQEELQRLNTRDFLAAIVSIYNRMEQEAQDDPEKKAVMRHVRLDDSAAAQPAFISGIEQRLGQVVRNLIDNAISFSPQDAEVRVSIHPGEQRVDIHVEDAGPGIPQDALERIFSRFYTDRPDPNAFGQHSGLGLAISRQIVETHKGTLHAENRPPPHTGARFIVSLPRYAVI